MAETVHVVVGIESNKLLAGHDGKLTGEGAKYRADRANTEAIRLGTTERYKPDTWDGATFKRKVKEN